jgi:monofunctional biosynthetic peptidoglycan transglycosylase
MFGYKARLRRKRSFRRRWGFRLFLFCVFALLIPIPLILGMRWINPPTTAFMMQTKFALYADGKPYGIKHKWVDYEKISPPMRLAVVAAEDQRFPLHGGFDWKAIMRANRHNGVSKRVKGGSTISQQVAKNLFLWRDRSWFRKGLEAWLTVLVEWMWPKQRILEVYLNIAQFDQRTFGVGAAAPRLLKKPPARLSASEAALLTAVLPAPTQFSAAKPTSYVRSRQYAILRQMARLGPAYLKKIEQPATSADLPQS